MDQKVFLISFILFVRIIFCVKYEGDPCSIKSNNSTGICRRSRECPEAFQNPSIRPDLCMFMRNEAVICCPLPEADNLPGLSQDENRFVDDEIRISKIKCKEYSKITVKNNLVSVLLPDPIFFEVSTQNCDQITPLIVNGEKAKFGEFPHMAAVGYRSKEDQELKFTCGGVLISEDSVLSAAHCLNLFGEPPSIVRLGGSKLRTDPDKYEDYEVERVYLHPEYKKTLLYNDIGIIRLKHHVKFSKFIRPACLWPSDEMDSKTMVATGWGVTKFGGQRSNDLLKVTLDLYSTNSCKSIYKTHKKLPKGILDTQFCAGTRQGSDTCQGDSGGPIQVVSKENKCVYYITGITSFGKSCGSKNAPGVYSKVSSYLDWIEDIVWSNLLEY